MWLFYEYTIIWCTDDRTVSSSDTQHKSSSSKTTAVDSYTMGILKTTMERLSGPEFSGRRVPEAISDAKVLTASFKTDG